MHANTIVLILGIINSCLIHLARSLQRMGIHSYDRFKNHILGKALQDKDNSRHYIYILGILLSNFCVIFVILAGKIGTVSYFTAMYSVGMFPMLLFTKFVMKESSGFQNWLGVALIISGSYMINLGASSSKPVDMGSVNTCNLLIVIIVIIIISPVFILWGKKTGLLWKDAFSAGLTAGMIASLDPVLKASGQHFGAGSGIFPAHVWGWVLFLSSFAASTAALFITQQAYSRKVYASQLIPYYNVAYVVMPIIVQLLIIPHYKPAGFDLIGIVIIITGVIVFSERELRITKNADIIKEERVHSKNTKTSDTTERH